MTKDSYGYINHADPQTLNLYTYCGNNPVSRVDPNGLDFEDGGDDETLHNSGILSDNDIAAIQGYQEQYRNAPPGEEGDAIRASAHEAAYQTRQNAVSRSVTEGWGGGYNTGGIGNNYLHIDLTTPGTSKGVYISKDGLQPYAGAGGTKGGSLSISIGDFDRKPSGGWNSLSPSIQIGKYGVFSPLDHELGVGVGGGRFSATWVYVAPIE